MSEQRDGLRDLYDEYMGDTKFSHLRQKGIRFVPGSGVINPKVMIIGEAPGPMENAKAQPFIGRSGALLEQYLTDEQFDTFEDIFTTNAVHYWPRVGKNKSRHPTLQEMQDSKSYLDDEIKLVDPVVVGLLGISVISLFLPKLQSVGPNLGKLFDEHGNLAQFNGKFVPLYHPALVLHTPAKKHAIKNGFYNLKMRLNEKLGEVA